MSSSNSQQTTEETEATKRSERALADLIKAYRSEDDDAIKTIISENGSTTYGKLSLESIWKSSEFMFEPGTSVVKVEDNMVSARKHSFLVTPGGAVETIAGPLQEAHLREEKPDVLTCRILHSLQGMPTPLSQPDYVEVVSAVKRAETNHPSAASKRVYEETLTALQSAREKQLASGSDGMFKLNLSKMPYSMQPKYKHGWPRGTDKDIDTLARWALIQVSKNHALGVEGGTHDVVEHLTLDHFHLSQGDYFSEQQKNHLRLRLNKVANEQFHSQDMENAWHPEKEIGWEVGIPVCDDGGEGCEQTQEWIDMGDRFRNTLILDHNLQPYRFDVALATAAKGRALSSKELTNMMTDDLVKEYEYYSHDTIKRPADTAEFRPTKYISIEDDEMISFWQTIAKIRNRTQDRNPKLKDIPTEGYDSLLAHVRSILRGDGKEAWNSRYGSDCKDDSLVDTFNADNRLSGFGYWLENAGENIFLKNTNEDVESTLPPDAYRQWKEVEAASGPGGLNLRDYVITMKGYGKKRAS